MDLLLDNCLVMVGKRLLPKQVLLSNGKVAAIAELGEKVPPVKRIDCKEKILLPGLIDSHVHFRCPGAEHEEDWNTGSSAAIAGGITTVIDMPNNNPSCTTQEVLKKKREIAKRDSLCNFAFHFGATNDNQQELMGAEGVASFKVFMGSSTGSLLVTDEGKLKQIFSIAKERNIVVTVHAEDEGVIQKNITNAKAIGWNHAKYHSKIRNNEAEEKGVEKALALQVVVGNKLHFLHISTKEAIKLIADAKKEGRNITCEVTPHHLFLDDSAAEKLGNFAKVNPSLKSKEDVKALWEALGKNIVDTIGTDHAPHTRAEKEKPYWEAPSGIPGCETMLPLLLDAVNKEKISLQQIVELCSKNPADIFGIGGKGELKEGYAADLVLVDLKKEITIKNGSLYTKCNWSPFATLKLKGAVDKTFVGGREVVL